MSFENLNLSFEFFFMGVQKVEIFKDSEAQRKRMKHGATTGELETESFVILFQSCCVWSKDFIY